MRVELLKKEIRDAYMRNEAFQLNRYFILRFERDREGVVVYLYSCCVGGSESLVEYDRASFSDDVADAAVRLTRIVLRGVSDV